MAVARKRTKMKRTQVCLMPEEYEKARRMADARRVSLSQVVRELLRSAPEDECSTNDPLRDIIGMVKDVIPNASQTIDEVVYGEDIR
jgi:hypothetical protein